MKDKFSIIYNEIGPCGISWLDEDSDEYIDIMIGDEFALKTKKPDGEYTVSKIQYPNGISANTSKCTLINIRVPSPDNRIEIAFNIEDCIGNDIVNYITIDQFGYYRSTNGDLVEFKMEKVTCDNDKNEDIGYEKINISKIIKDSQCMEKLNILRDIYLKLIQLENIIDGFLDKNIHRQYDYSELFKNIDNVLVGLAYMKYGKVFDDITVLSFNIIGTKCVNSFLPILTAAEENISDKETELLDDYISNNIKKSIDDVINSIRCFRMNIIKAESQEDTLPNKIIVARELIGAYIYFESINRHEKITDIGENILEYIILIYNYILEKINEYEMEIPNKEE